MSLIIAMGLAIVPQSKYQGLEIEPIEKNRNVQITTESIPSPVFFGSPEEAVYYEMTTGIQTNTPIIDLELLSNYLERKQLERELEVANWKPLLPGGLGE